MTAMRLFASIKLLSVQHNSRRVNRNELFFEGVEFPGFWVFFFEMIWRRRRKKGGRGTIMKFSSGIRGFEKIPQIKTMRRCNEVFYARKDSAGNRKSIFWCRLRGKKIPRIIEKNLFFKFVTYNWDEFFLSFEMSWLSRNFGKHYVRQKYAAFFHFYFLTENRFHWSICQFGTWSFSEISSSIPRASLLTFFF